MLNDFNTHRNNAKNTVPNLTEGEFCLTSNNDLELNEINKTEQNILSENYKKELNDYNKSLTPNNTEINNKININNNKKILIINNYLLF